MRFLSAFRGVVSFASLLGCLSLSMAQDEEDVGLGRAGEYYAQQIPGFVILSAFGEAPTPGYVMNFRQLPIEIFPPQFAFAWKAPDGIVPQVITPFRFSAYFKTEARIDEITIKDAEGDHVIKVVQLPKVDDSLDEGEEAELDADGTDAFRSNPEKGDLQESVNQAIQAAVQALSKGNSEIGSWIVQDASGRRIRVSMGSLEEGGVIKFHSR